MLARSLMRRVGGGEDDFTFCIPNNSQKAIDAASPGGQSIVQSGRGRRHLLKGRYTTCTKCTNAIVTYQANGQPEHYNGATVYISFNRQMGAND